MDILVCLEGSASTASAVDVAIDVALTLPAALSGLAIVDEPDIVAGAATSIGASSFKKERDETLLADAHAQAQKWLDGFLDRASANGVMVRALELRGRPAEMILEEMQKHDLTVLGRHANFRFETQDRDNRTRDRILRRAGKPMIVAPENAPPLGRTVMAAFDGSAAATRALRSFAQSGLAKGRDVHVVSVHDDGAIAFEIATAGCDLLGGLDVLAVPHNIVSDQPIADALLDTRKKLGADLIVLGGYVPSVLPRLLWGSVTHDILEKTPVPVFLHY
jgi:nucleotide-binding universal stress UspA family protein